MLVLLYLADGSGACEPTGSIHDTEPIINSAALRHQHVWPVPSSSPINLPKR